MQDKTQLRVGIFVAAGLLLAMYIIFMIGSEQQFFETQYTLKTTFKDVSGLRVGAPVHLAGLKVGYVSDIKFTGELERKEVEVILKINKKYKDRIRTDSIASIYTQGLLGDKFIYISVGTPAESALEDGAFIKGKDEMDIAAIVREGGEIADDMKGAASSARKFFEDLYTGKEDVRAAIGSFKRIMEEIEKGEGTLHSLIYPDKEGPDKGELAKDLKAAARDLRNILDRINRGEGTVGGLISDPGIYNDIRAFLGRVNRNQVLKSIVRSTIKENEAKKLKE